MAISKEQMQSVEQWFNDQWDKYIAYILEVAAGKQQPSTADLEKLRKALEEQRAATNEVRNRYDLQNQSKAS